MTKAQGKKAAVVLAQYLMTSLEVVAIVARSRRRKRRRRLRLRTVRC